FAGAIGVKGATRMRKADLIEAILDAANGGSDTKPAPADADGNGATDAPKPRCVRSARASQAAADDPIAALAAEENALGADAAVEEPVMPRPRARRTPATSTSTETAPADPSE